MISRQTAKKVRIWDLMRGEWVKNEGMEPSYVTTGYGENVSRARILATVTAKFISEDKAFGSLTLDDGTDTIRIKVFKSVKPVEDFKTGDVVDVVGRVREYEGEIYIIPEVIRKVSDPNIETLRRLEIIYKIEGIKKTKDLINKYRDDFPKNEELKKALIEKGMKREWIDIALGGKELTNKKSDLRKVIMDILMSSPDGIEYSELIKKASAEEADAESVINDLLSEGICYEPSPGKIKKI